MSNKALTQSILCPASHHRHFCKSCEDHLPQNVVRTPDFSFNENLLVSAFSSHGLFSLTEDKTEHIITTYNAIR